jgi:hypothetical protein
MFSPLRWKNRILYIVNSKFDILNLDTYVVRIIDGRSAFKVLTGYLAEVSSLERSRCRWEDIIRIDLKEIGLSTRSWVDSAQDRDH